MPKVVCCQSGDADDAAQFLLAGDFMFLRPLRSRIQQIPLPEGDNGNER